MRSHTTNSHTTNSHTNPATTRLSKLAAVALGAALTLTACGGSGSSDAIDVDVETAPTTALPTTAPTTTALPTDDSTDQTAPATDEADEAAATVPATTAIRAISAVDQLDVFAGPDSDIVVASLDDRTDFGSARVLLVEETVDGWVRVQLPVRPNGTSGWVRATDVTLEEIDARVEVDLETRTATAWLDGEVLLTTPVAVGSPDNPTPTGTFFVTDKVDTVNDGGAYGPYALGLSAHSDTLTEFAGGDGQIGLHGTNAPTSIGQAVSHGCVRFPNVLITVLATELPLGTPVVIA